ncbi:MAG: STAS domain-containing protein [Anaerolineales bacterium]|nr:STAS domain-containing protein [Anaerolineales bacterium]MCK5634208.1 STAS domain-containing protein [Anaerolineales bacterium]
MEITVKGYKRVVVVTVTGRVDSVTYSEFESVLQAELEQGRVNVALDFSGVEFISSAGLRVLVNARKTVKNAGGKIVIAQPSLQVSETLEIAGLEVLFEQFPDRESAIAAF